MILGRVIGTITSTINHPFYEAKKLLIVEKTDAGGEPLADYLIAVDVVDAGVGERVLVLDEGNGGRQIFAAPDAPIRSVVVGIIDGVDEGRGESGEP
ncbi:MAG: EutN/CcmL family microcompartment protein [Thermoanaerobaculaceae bacterium]|nr:EutN/CcmL family microcompartment protein [Thermoanaerobaculaceae bacterium]